MRRRPKTPPPSPEPAGPGERQGRRELGSAGEAAVAAHYRALGFAVVAHNLRTRHGELDLVVRRWRLLVAVEVKTRSDHPAPERLVDARELARRECALRAVARVLVPSGRLRLRVDVAAVRWPAGGEPEVVCFPGQESP